MSYTLNKYQLAELEDLYSEDAGWNGIREMAEYFNVGVGVIRWAIDFHDYKRKHTLITLAYRKKHSKKCKEWTKKYYKEYCLKNYKKIAEYKKKYYRKNKKKWLKYAKNHAKKVGVVNY